MSVLTNINLPVPVLVLFDIIKDIDSISTVVLYTRDTIFVLPNNEPRRKSFTSLLTCPSLTVSSFMIRTLRADLTLVADYFLKFVIRGPHLEMFFSKVCVLKLFSASDWRLFEN